MGDFLLCISSKSWMKPGGLSSSELPRGSWSFAVCFCALLVGSGRQAPAPRPLGLSSLPGESLAAPARDSFRLLVVDGWLPMTPAESHSFSEMGLVPLWLDSFSLSSPHLDWVSSLSLSFPWFRVFLIFWCMRWWRTRLCFRVKVRSQVWHLYGLSPTREWKCKVSCKVTNAPPSCFKQREILHTLEIQYLYWTWVLHLCRFLLLYHQTSSWYVSRYTDECHGAQMKNQNLGVWRFPQTWYGPALRREEDHIPQVPVSIPSRLVSNFSGRTL